MKASRKLNRRSFMASVAGALAAGTAAARNTQRASPHDSDCGAQADRAPGDGKISDRDSGANADPACRGRGRPPRPTPSSCSDTDRGRNADPANRGRTCIGR